MMKQLVLATSLLASTSLMAGISSVDFMKTVAESKAVKELSLDASAQGFNDLVKIEKTATYRCPGCFDYSVTFRQYTMGGKIDLVKKVGTRMTNFASGSIEVSIKDEE